MRRPSVPAITLCALIGGAVTLPGHIAVRTSLVHAQASGQASLAQVYARAMNATVHASRFRITASTGYPRRPWYAPERWYTTELGYIAPDRAYSARMGPTIPRTRWVQVGGDLCSWSLGARFHRIYCSHTPWHVNGDAVRHFVPIVPAHPTLRRLRTERGVTGIGIRGTVQTSLCLPDQFCSLSGNVRYEGTLLVNARTGKPENITSHVYRAGRVAIDRSVTYSFGKPAQIALPRGARVACPTWASGQRCLAKPRTTASASPRPWPAVTPANRRAALAALTGFGRAVVRRDVRAARTFLSPTLARRCGSWTGERAAQYLRCLLVDTPLPTAYHVQILENLTRTGTRQDALVFFRLPNGRIQPLWVIVHPTGRGARISGIGLPTG